MANKTKIVHVAIEAERYRELSEMAKRADRPMSQVVREAIHHMLLAARQYQQQVVEDKPRKEKP